MTADTVTMTVVMAWRNLWRNRRRTLITVTAMVLGLALCIPMYGMMAWLTAEMTRGITRLHLGNIQVHDPRDPEELNLLDAFPASAAEKIGALDGVQAVSPRVYSGGMISADHRIAVRIRVTDSVVPRGSRLVSGKGLEGDAGPCATLLPVSLAERWHIVPGSSLRLDPLPQDDLCDRLQVIGLISKQGKDRHDLFVTSATLVRIAPKQAHRRKAVQEIDDDIDDLPRLPEGRNERATALGPDTEGARAARQDTPGLAEPDSTTRTQRPRPATPAPRHRSGRTPAGRRDNSFEKAATATAGRIETHETGAPKPRTLDWHVVRSTSEPVGIMAVDSSSERRVTAVADSIVKGRYLPDEPGFGPLPVVIGKPLADKLLVEPGDRLGMDVMGPDGFPIDAIFEVVGIFETGVTALDRSLVQAPLEMAWRKDMMNLRDAKTGEGLVNELAIRTREGFSEEQMASRIRAVVPGLLVRTWRQVDPNTAQILKYQDSATAVFLAIIFVIAALGTTNTMLMSVQERTKEFGVLKSIGMGPGRVAALILFEALVMTALATILGSLLGAGITSWVSYHGLDLRSINPEGLRYQGLVISPIWRALLNEQVVAVPAILLATVSLAVAVWPALRAARIRPIEALHNET